MLVTEALASRHSPCPAPLLLLHCCAGTGHRRCQPESRLSGQEHVPGGMEGLVFGQETQMSHSQCSSAQGHVLRESRQGLICKGRRFIFPNDSHQGSPREAGGMMGSGVGHLTEPPICFRVFDWPSPGGTRSVFSFSSLLCVCTCMCSDTHIHTELLGRVKHRNH